MWIKRVSYLTNEAIWTMLSHIAFLWSLSVLSSLPCPCPFFNLHTLLHCKKSSPGGTHAAPPSPPGLYLTPIKHLMPDKGQFSKQASVAFKATRKGKWKLLKTVLNHQGCGWAGDSQTLSSFSEASRRVVFALEQEVSAVFPKAPLEVTLLGHWQHWS